MTDIASSEQQPAWAASVNPRKDEHASTNDPEAEVRDEWPRRPDSMASSSDRGGHVYSGQGQSQEAAIVLPSDSESDSEDQDTPCSDSSLPSINTIIGTLPAQSQREVASSELIESTLPTTLRTTPSTPDTGGDLDGAACDSSAGYISPGTTCEEQEQTQRASSRNRSPIDSTVESSCTRLPDNDDVAITQQSYEPTAHTVSLVCSQRDFDSKGPSKDDDKLHCQGPSSKPLRKRDSISLEKAGSDSGNNSSQEGSNGGDDSSDVDGNDNGDESDESDDSSGTANDDAASGGHGSRRCDSDNSPSETDKEKERPSNISSDNESDNNCHRPRKRRRVTKDQESDQTRRAKVHRAESRSCSLPVQSLSRQSRRAGVGFAPSPPTSHDMSGLETESDEDGIVQPTASFSEWQLHDATLKSVMINGITTYQLLFKRACRAKARQVSHEKPKSCSQTKDFHGWPSQERGRRVRFSAEEDELIIELKEKLGLSWTEIYDRCSTTFVRRSKEALQVRYCTKLKGRR